MKAPEERPVTADAVVNLIRELFGTYWDDKCETAAQRWIRYQQSRHLTGPQRPPAAGPMSLYEALGTETPGMDFREELREQIEAMPEPSVPQRDSTAPDFDVEAAS